MYVIILSHNITVIDLSVVAAAAVQGVRRPKRSLDQY